MDCTPVWPHLKHFTPSAMVEVWKAGVSLPGKEYLKKPDLCLSAMLPYNASLMLGTQKYADNGIRRR